VIFFLSFFSTYFQCIVCMRLCVCLRLILSRFYFQKFLSWAIRLQGEQKGRQEREWIHSDSNTFQGELSARILTNVVCSTTQCFPLFCTFCMFMSFIYYYVEIFLIQYLVPNIHPGPFSPLWTRSSSRQQ
jgi:hypothetical protein